MPDPTRSEPRTGPGSISALDPPQAVATILNVDDSEPNRYAVTRMLRRAGFATLEAANGLEALSQVALQPDLVILDVNLPDLDGFEVCRRIKADPSTASIPVLHMSASYTQSQDKTRGLDEGADGYLIRPVEPPELIATVRALLRVRAAERMARHAAVQWQATFDAIGDGVCLLDRDGRVLRSNQAAVAILGLEPDRIAGRPFADLVPVSDPPTDLAIGDRWFQLGVDPIVEDGAPVGSVCILADVTDRRRLADELRDKAAELVEDDRRKDEFLAMLAHELRNPLAPILNAFEVMRGGPGAAEAEDFGPLREVAERQVRHLARLVDDLLDVSRITSSKIRLRPVAVDLVEILGRVVEAARPAVEARRHTLTVAIEAAALPMKGDPTRLDQVLTNLVNNAIKYTEPGGTIAIRADRAGPFAEVRVSDDGIGIPAEMLPRVFDLFTQVDRALDRSQGGLGIGLTLVRRLVELHGGTATVASRGAGLGSEFTVRLPLDLDPAPRVAPPRAVVAAASAPRRILVVDDQADAAAILARLLRGRGHDVRVAADGLSALEVAAEHRAEVILLDIGLPGMDGYETARRLRDRPETRASLLIALTGYGQEEDIRLALDAGFDRHLVKPTDLDAIEAILARGR